MDKELFWACLSKASQNLEQQTEEHVPTEEEEEALEAAMEQEGELATLVAQKMGLL